MKWLDLLAGRFRNKEKEMLAEAEMKSNRGPAVRFKLVKRGVRHVLTSCREPGEKKK